METVPALKRCSRCAEHKARTEFYACHDKADGLNSWCKACTKATRPKKPKVPKAPYDRKAYDKQWRAAHPGYDRARYWQDKAKARVQHVRSVYGITAEQYEAMVRSQHGVCAICGVAPQKTELHVDHCHASGVVRGLLCSRCNSVLGFVRDSPGMLRTAAHYLEDRINGVLPKETAQWP